MEHITHSLFTSNETSLECGNLVLVNSTLRIKDGSVYSLLIINKSQKYAIFNLVEMESNELIINPVNDIIEPNGLKFVQISLPPIRIHGPSCLKTPVKVMLYTTFVNALLIYSIDIRAMWRDMNMDDSKIHKNSIMIFPPAMDMEKTQSNENLETEVETSESNVQQFIIQLNDTDKASFVDEKSVKQSSNSSETTYVINPALESSSVEDVKPDKVEKAHYANEASNFSHSKCEIIISDNQTDCNPAIETSVLVKQKHGIINTLDDVKYTVELLEKQAENVKKLSKFQELCDPETSVRKRAVTIKEIGKFVPEMHIHPMELKKIAPQKILTFTLLALIFLFFYYFIFL
ncbi:hypothetical protein T4E_323 [Trichinella pseudospiralis]|uniref:MSP domain-containing protein n=1 Tax=Trichinella pseudospiralis TaxID=6337 RepID=A0A0V0YKG9_TRIPS|nr:hypothetical protein T4E_323 [Trichinella pseudospiralis]